MPAENIALTEAVYYILLSLYTPLHGYGIMQNVERLSAGRVKLAAGTLYGAISAMLEKGWIKAFQGEKNSRKKEYQITEFGRKAAANELQRLRELLENGQTIIEGDKNEKDNF
jgi:DNA-binding PadR family transcriptional regulator